MKHAIVAALALVVIVVVRPAWARTWSAETVDDPPEGAGEVSSIAVDSAGRPHIAYFDLVAGQLRYAHKTASGSWFKTTVDSSGIAGFGVSLALDASDNPHITYHRSATSVSNGDIMYAKGTCILIFGTFPFCSFAKEVIAAGVHSQFQAGNTSVALDASGNVHVSYFDHVAGQLKWGKKQPGSAWSLANVATAPGGFTSLAVDSLGFPQIAWSNSGTGTISYARVICFFILCGFGIDDTVDAGTMGSLKLTASDQPVIAYTSGWFIKFGAGTCTRSEADCTSWSLQQVASGGSALAHPSLALDASGSPFIAFLVERGFNLSSLQFARRWLRSWVVETADFDVSTQGSSSLALDAGGLPHISFQANTTGALRYVKGGPTPPPFPFAVDASTLVAE
jgi:hypothetical protein